MCADDYWCLPQDPFRGELVTIKAASNGTFGCTFNSVGTGWHGRLRVSGVGLRGAAARCGLDDDDEIVAVDGKPIDEKSFPMDSFKREVRDYVFEVIRPSDARTRAESTRFRWQLQNSNLLYLSAKTVLVMLDVGYPSRFWTQLEFWLSQQTPTATGLLAATTESRAHILPIHNANVQLR